MPEFILDTGGCERFAALDDFTQGYIEAMFFTDTGTGDDEELEHATVAEFAPGELARIAEDCVAWQKSHEELLDDAFYAGLENGSAYEPIQAGRDYWFSRNGHGVGFWDRGLGDVGDKLHAACKYSERYLCRGDDGLLYLG
jgi:hypothetical protein